MSDKYANTDDKGELTSNTYATADIGTNDVLTQWSAQPGATPTRFWKWCNESDFIIDKGIINEGNFGKVVHGRFLSIDKVREKHRNFADLEVALKYPKDNSTFFMEFHKLSHEISCTVIHHPSIVNYMGGLNVTNPRRVDPDGVGVVMEYCETDLRRAIQNNLEILTHQKERYRIAKEIASGMLFLHSLVPHVLHRDLRCPNVLLTKKYTCRIADFGISTNMGYTDMKHTELYQDLTPPECKRKGGEFVKKSDTFFYGWLLMELFLGKKPEIGSFEWKGRLNLFEGSLVQRCIDENLDKRPEWDEIIRELNSQLGIKVDLELLARSADESAIKSHVASFNWNSVKNETDSFDRNLFHMCCIYGNLAGLKYLVSVGGQEFLHKPDKFGLTCAHFAARNGYLDILKFLSIYKINFDVMEKRFDATPLTLAIAMKHFDCVKFLGTQVTQESLNSGLISAASEGVEEVADNLISIGADMSTVDPDLKKTPLMWASSNGHPKVVELLLKRGANINYARSRDNVTAIYQAAEKGQKECVAILLEHGADINIKRNDDSTPFWQACWKGHNHVVHFLIEKKVDIFVPKRNTSPLQIAIAQGHIPIVLLLLQNGYKLNEAKRPYLYDACVSSKKNPDLVAQLVKLGANVKETLDYAKKHGQFDEVKNMLDKYCAGKY